MSPRPKLIKRISGIPASSGFVPLHGENAEPVVLLLRSMSQFFFVITRGLLRLKPHGK